jgi:hypothetical protein
MWWRCDSCARLTVPRAGILHEMSEATYTMPIPSSNGGFPIGKCSRMMQPHMGTVAEGKVFTIV